MNPKKQKSRVKLGWLYLAAGVSLIGALLGSYGEHHSAGIRPDLKVLGMSDGTSQSQASSSSAKVSETRPEGVAQQEQGISNHLLSRDTMVRYILKCNYRSYLQEAELIVDSVYEAYKVYEVPPVILLALIKVESDYRPGVISEANAVGLTQVHVPTWIENDDNPHNLITQGIVSSKHDLFDPSKNIMAGAYIFKRYLDEGISKALDNPVDYATTRYLGGSNNSHYQKLESAIGAYYVFANGTEGILNKKGLEL